MADYSLDQLIEWMKEQPRTLGWGMICAFDRTQLNTLLTQEYIRRFKTSSYLDPISGTIPNGDERRFALKDFTLDRPRLSFENVDLNDSKARLRMRVVGGTQLGLKNLGGQWYTREIRETSPLQGPELSLNLRLDQVPGVVGDQGELRLDLKYSDDFRMTVSEDRIEQNLVGAYFQQKFAALDDEKRVFPIGRIERGDNELLQPQSFVMRTQARRRTADDPEGAVLGFVRWKGDREGTLPAPDSGFRYLIPNDGNRSTTVLLDAKRVLLSLVADAFAKKAKNPKDVAFEILHDSQGLFQSLEGRGGSISVPSWRGTASYDGDFFDRFWETRASYEVSESDLALTHRLRISIPSPGVVSFRFDAVDDVHVSLTDVDDLTGSFGETLTAAGYDKTNLVAPDRVTYRFSIEASYRLTDDGGASFERENFTVRELMNPNIYWGRIDKPQGCDDNFVCLVLSRKLDEIVSWIARSAEENLSSSLCGVGSIFRSILSFEFQLSLSIETLLLDIIKLNFGSAVIADELRAPNDVGVFGRVNPRTTSFVVSPVEHNLVAGTTRQFAVTPATGDLRWSVEPILAGVLSEQIGTIDPQTGLYTAPTADSFSGLFVRLRITATSQGNGFSSSALVTVLRNALQVNPVAYVMQAKATLSLEAGYLGEASRLTWAIKDASLGGVVAGQGLTAQYIAPQTMPPSDPDDPYDAGLAFIADEVEVRDAASGVLSTAVVIVESATKSPMLVTREVDPATGSVQLVAFINGRPRDPAKVEWDVRHGPGTFGNTNGKPNGVYTCGPSGDQTFALLTATYRSEDDGVFEGYVLQPLPISELEAAVRGTGVYELANANKEDRP
ncbi:hypothetical protein [Pseudomonas sp. UBA6562]|uniref:hypothetical protein n=1 Tax=Pseudomonas sp. UBA6562 TaxID=1947332 RepID=UPI0025D389EA|nr:hypothetical protein [Pseudomonas sp. UBA6562]